MTSDTEHFRNTKNVLKKPDQENIYPLHTQWVLYYNVVQTRRNLAAESYSEILTEICTIDTVPELMYMIENVQEANLWPLNSNIHFFRNGITPLWEDINNMKGGKWVIEIPKSNENKICSDLWNKTLIYAASEMIRENKNINKNKNEKLICGAVFSPRKMVDRIALWTRYTDDDALNIGKEWKSILNTNFEMVFKIHENALKGIRERKNNLYVL